jgi:hypothetical protein
VPVVKRLPSGLRSSISSWSRYLSASDVRYAIRTLMTDRCYADGAVNPTGDETVQTNGAGLFDCDSRYYEPTDSYTPCLPLQYLDCHLRIVNYWPA